MNDWQTVNLGELGDFKNGANFTRSDFGFGHPIINVKNLYDGRYVSINDLDELKPNTLPNPDIVSVQKNDILFARSSVKASGAGQVAMVNKYKPKTIFSGFIIRFRITKNELVEANYLNYLLRSSEYRELLTRIASGTTITNLSQDTLSRLPIRLPPLPEQRAIAGILGALDDKIELNRRMNRTLESMARGVFRQWFVEGEKVAGWKVGKLGDVAENIRRSADADEIDPETHYIGLEHMPRGSIALSEWGNASELASNKFMFKEGEFLFGKLRPYFHKVGIAPIDGVCSTDILVIAPKSPEWYGFVLGHISSVELINYTNAASTGTKMPRTNWSDIANYEVAIPPLAKAKEFTEIFLPMAKRIRANIMESRTLASLRDSLLPKLMRGEVRVKLNG